MPSRRSRFAAVAVPLVLAAGLPSAAAAAGWTTGVPTSVAGAPASAPRVAADADGGVTAAWLRDGKVQAGTRGANGAFAGVDVSEAGATAPQLAVNGAGRAILAWTRGDGIVEAAIRPSATAPFGTPVALSHVGAGDVRVAIDGAGTASVLWLRGDLVEMKRRAAGDAAWPATATSFAEEWPSNPSLAATPSGRAVAIWSVREGASFVIRTSLVGPGPWSAPTTVDFADDIAGGGVTSDLTADGDDSVTGVWDRHDVFPRAPQVIAGRRLGAAPFSGIASISDGAVDDHAASPKPAVAANLAADAAAVWLHRVDDVTTVELARRNGAASFGDPVAISVPGADHVAPDVAVDPVGRAAVIWLRGGVVEARRTPGEPAAVAALSGADATAPQLAFDAAGNAVAVWARAGRIETAAFDQTAPSVTATQAPTAAETGEHRLFEATAADGQSAAEVRWDFGDGETATGTSVKHRYLKPGTFTAVATAVDGGGNTATRAITIVVTGDPVVDPPKDGGGVPVNPYDPSAQGHGTPTGPAGPTGPGVPAGPLTDRAAPRLTSLAIARKVRTGRAAKITLKLDEAARVVVRVKRGTRTLPGSVAAQLAAGKRTITLKGRLAGRKLKPGRYTLVVVGTDAAGNASAPRRLTFRVVR